MTEMRIPYTTGTEPDSRADSNGYTLTYKDCYNQMIPAAAPKRDTAHTRAQAAHYALVAGNDIDKMIPVDVVGRWLDRILAAPDPQTAVAQATAERGYCDGWTSAQFFARQVAKLQEKLAKLAARVELPESGYLAGELSVGTMIAGAGESAQWDFDNCKDGWGIVDKRDALDYLKSKLTDLQAAVFNAANALSHLTGEHFDVAQAAMDKARADVGRRVR